MFKGHLILDRDLESRLLEGLYSCIPFGNDSAWPDGPEIACLPAKKD